jgi:choline kinase
MDRIELGRSIVLLAAGRGERLRPLTESTPKCLLTVGGQPVLGLILDEILRWNPIEIVVATGFMSDVVSAFVSKRAGPRAHCILNERYQEDVNIYSTHLAVERLRQPECGYLVIETDLVLDAAAWRIVFAAGRRRHSFWVTKGQYGEHLTGGILRSDPNDNITELGYVPQFDVRYMGWRKLVGILGVGPDQVAADRSTRRTAVSYRIDQYYMIPWIENLACLPCKGVDLGESVAMSFNTRESYDEARRWFAESRNG